MNSSSFCPFGCNLPYPNVDKIICHGRCNVKTMDQGTQTGPTFEDFYTEDEERQFLAVMMQKSRYAAVLSATLREAEEERRLRHQLAELQRELYGRPADRHRQREVVEDNPVVENGGRQQNLAGIQQPPLEAREQQPRQEMMEVRQARQDLAALQPPVLDFPENLRIQEELVERKRPRLELVVGEQPPREIFEPQPESAKGQQLQQQQLVEGQVQQESFENGPQPQLVKSQQSQQNVVQEQQLEQQSVESA